MYDMRYLFLLCPYCLESKDKKLWAFELPKKDDFKNNPIDVVKQKYISQIWEVVNSGIIEDEKQLVEYFNKECNHFFHKKCLNPKKHECFLCKNYFNEINLVVFAPLEKEEHLYDVLFSFEGLTFLPSSSYKTELYKNVRYFLQNEPSIKKEIREKFIEQFETYRN